MAHLLDYENAKGDKAKALAACEVIRAKNSKGLAWGWADDAINHAVAAGANEDALQTAVGDGRWPDADALEAEIRRQLGG